MFKETVPFVNGGVMSPFYKETVSFCFDLILFVTAYVLSLQCEVASLDRHPMLILSVPLHVAPDRIRQRNRIRLAAEVLMMRVLEVIYRH